MKSNYYSNSHVTKNRTDDKIRFSLPRKTVFLTAFMFFSVLIFDALVASSSVMEFRLIYDISFALIMLALGYTSMMLLSDAMFSSKCFEFVFPGFSCIVPVMLNVSAILSIIWLGIPSIGFLGEDILLQGLSGLLPLLIFLLVMGVNAVTLYVNIHGNAEIRLYRLAAYVLGIIAVETCLAIYAFHMTGIEGMRWVLSLFHVTFIGLTIWSHRNFKTARIRIKIATSDLLLILLSVGIFAMIYVPFGLYNLYFDNAVVAGSTLSIVERGSLQPYYAASSYYSPIMGFVSILFAYTTGLDNLLLSSNLPFLVASLLLPFVTYHFIKSFIIDDPRIAIIGAIIASLMDGLAVLVLPVYAGNITFDIINWKISSATQSLYYSNISHLWLTPYKTFAAVAGVAACSVLDNKRTASYVLSGALFFMSLSNPRYSILTVLLLILLLGIRKIDVKGVALFTLSVIVSGGFALPVHLYKQLLSLSSALSQRGYMGEAFFNQIDAPLKSLVSYDAFPLVITIALMAFVGITILTRFKLSKEPDTVVFASQFSPREFPRMILRTGRRGKKLLVSSISIILISITFTMFIFAVVYAYSPDTLNYLTSNPFLAILNSSMMRYHILLVFFVVGLLALKFRRRIAFAIILIIVVFYFGGILSDSILLLPMIFTILAIPLLSSLVKQKRKLLVFPLLLFVFLGLFSATFYSAAVTESTSTDYTDLSSVLSILLEKEPFTSVYSPSSYTYFVYRVARMAHLNLVSDPSCGLYIIDKDYIKNETMASFLKDANFTILYSGCKFILLERQ